MEIEEIHFSTLPSTNEWAKEHAKTFAQDRITLIVAEEQSSGKGRFGKHWFSPKGKNIYASFVFFIDENFAEPLSLTHVMALAAAHVLKSYDIVCQIKWPNDLLVEGKKIAGILCETVALNSHFCVIIGIGLNVQITEEELKNVGQKATSILIETKKKEEIKVVLEALKREFAHDLDIFLKKGFAPFREEYTRLSIK